MLLEGRLSRQEGEEEMKVTNKNGTDFYCNKCGKYLGCNVNTWWERRKKLHWTPSGTYRGVDGVEFHLCPNCEYKHQNEKKE